MLTSQAPSNLPLPRSPNSAVSQLPPSSPPRIAHRVLAAHPRPVGERRAGDQDRAEQLGPGGRQHHHGPARLAVADHRRLAFGLRVQLDDPLEERRLGVHDVFDRLAGHGFGQEADEVAGMAGLERDADFTVCLEAADARPVSGTRVDDDKRPLPRVDFDVRRRRDAHERVVHRSRQFAAIGNERAFELEHVRRRLREFAR